MKKTLKWIALAVVLLVIVGLVAVYLSINGIVKRTVEEQSTTSLNLQTTLNGAALSLFGGSVTLDDLSIANPQGYTAPKLLSVDGVDVQTRLSELRSDPVHVSSVRINKPTLVVEQQGGKFNVRAAMDQMPPTDPNAKPLRLVIDDLQIANATVIIHPGLGSLPVQIPGIKDEYTLTLPTLKLQNIGTGEGSQNGAALKEVVMTVVTKMASEATQSDQLPPELRQLLAGDLSQVTAQLKQQFNAKVEQITSDLSSKVGAQINERLGGLNLPLGGSTTGPTTRPGDAVGNTLKQGIGDLLGGQKKKDAPKR
jgi:uncharacterized protein involved in outer membrane biogenesis